MANEELVKSLTDLGFTALEAEVYVALLQGTSTTGYRIAQQLGKPAAGVYKAIDTLSAKGAVMVEEGESRLCRAIPPAELLARLSRQFRERKSAAADALRTLQASPTDDRIYQLESYEQVLDRCRGMLDRCRQLALIDSFPGPLEALRPDIEAAIARGVRVAVQGYAPTEFPGARVAQFPAQHPLVTSFPGEWIILVIDGAELLLAVVTREERRLLQGVWSNSLFLAFTLQCYILSEFTLTGLLNDPAMAPAAREVMNRIAVIDPTAVPGFPELLARLGASSVGEARQAMANGAGSTAAPAAGEPEAPAGPRRRGRRPSTRRTG